MLGGKTDPYNTLERMFRPLKTYEHIFLIALFGGLCAYFLYGAFSGHLYIPGKHGPGMVLTGLPAWLYVGVPPLIYSGILVRHQFLFPLLTPRLRAVVELTLIFGGLGLMLLAGRLHWEANCAL